MEVRDLSYGIGIALLHVDQVQRCSLSGKRGRDWRAPETFLDPLFENNTAVRIFETL